MGALDKALPGRQNAKDWLTLKIVECLAEPMDDHMAERLNSYNSAYNAICQWDEENSTSEPKAKDSKEEISFSMDMAKIWASKLQNEDGSKGPHWTVEQAKQIMAQRKLSINPAEFWMAMNLVYSDFSPVAKKHGVGGNLDFYVDMAKAFLDDKDSKKYKLSEYYSHVVK